MTDQNDHHHDKSREDFQPIGYIAQLLFQYLLKFVPPVTCDDHEQTAECRLEATPAPPQLIRLWVWLRIPKQGICEQCHQEQEQNQHAKYIGQ